jgi:hypothetical protein
MFMVYLFTASHTAIFNMSLVISTNTQRYETTHLLHAMLSLYIAEGSIFVELALY